MTTPILVTARRWARRSRQGCAENWGFATLGQYGRIMQNKSIEGTT